MPFITKGDVLRQNDYIADGVIKIGDLCALNAAGRVVVSAAGSNASIGVANSFASAAGQVVKVLDHPDQQYIGSASTAGINAVDLNLNFNIVANTTTSPEGNHLIDGASGATTAGLPVKVLSLSPESGATGPGTVGTRVVFIINNHALKGGTGTAGI